MKTENDMKMHDLHPAPGAKQKPRRLGRGVGSGLGKTAGKGHKGQWARSGGGVRVGFEGGQMPLMRRIPKRGFDNAWKKEYSTVNLEDLDKFFKEGESVTSETLLSKGVLSKVLPYGVKILGKGKLTKKLNVTAHKFSESAKKAIEAAGGKAEVIEIKQPALNPKSGKKLPKVRPEKIKKEAAPAKAAKPAKAASAKPAKPAAKKA